MIQQSIEYWMIYQSYGERAARRSGVRLMNHIDEGLTILDQIGASDSAKRAYCLHPLLQVDKDFEANYRRVAVECDPLAVLLATEYRRAANAYLCAPETDPWGPEDIRRAVGVLVPEVRHMLIADKIQNDKDFQIYHRNTHPRAEQLDRYFKLWLDLLMPVVEVVK